MKTPCKTVVLMGILSLLGLFGCENWKAFHTGTFNGEIYEVQTMETKGFSTNRIDYALKLGNRTRVVIDALTTNWGPPYADDIYGQTPRVYINKQHGQYENVDTLREHPSTMVYLSPKRFSRDDFDQYVAFLQQEGEAIDQKLAYREYNHFPHIIGLVYGETEDFVRTFRGKKAYQNYIILVEVDGRVRYGSPTLSSEEYSGLSQKVQMPGKRIYVATGEEAGLSRADVLTFQDKAGKTLADYFDLADKTARPNPR